MFCSELIYEVIIESLLLFPVELRSPYPVEKLEVNRQPSTQFPISGVA